MEEKFRETAGRLTPPGTRVWVAISGGVDSVVLAHLYHRTGQLHGLAHCHFGLRGAEADADAAFVDELGRQLDVPVRVRRFDTRSYARQKGLSLQMAARELRYEWFARLAEEEDARIATAHQANDLAETLLLNLTKGSGLAGLTGIPEVRDHLVRPLLAFNRTEIEDWARQQNITWREDSSNRSDQYQRNLLRHRVVPVLEKINPSFIGAAGRTAQRLGEAETFIKGLIEQGGWVQQQGKVLHIDMARLSRLPGYRAVLYQVLRPLGFNYTQIERIAITTRTGKVFDSRQHRLVVDRQQLVVSPRREPPAPLELQATDRQACTGPHRFHIRLVPAGSYRIPAEAHIAALDYDKLEFPLLLRPWQPGDSFVPLGMRGRKKVSDCLIDARVPRNLKKEVMVLVSGGKIAWLAGYRLADSFRISDTTRQVYEISLQANNDLNH